MEECSGRSPGCPPPVNTVISERRTFATIRASGWLTPPRQAKATRSTMSPSTRSGSAGLTTAPSDNSSALNTSPLLGASRYPPVTVACDKSQKAPPRPRSSARLPSSHRRAVGLTIPSGQLGPRLAAGAHPRDHDYRSRRDRGAGRAGPQTGSSDMESHAALLRHHGPALVSISRRARAATVATPARRRRGRPRPYARRSGYRRGGENHGCRPRGGSRTSTALVPALSQANALAWTSAVVSPGESTSTENAGPQARSDRLTRAPRSVPS